MTAGATAMNDAVLLDLWEAGSRCQGLDRALLMLWGSGAAMPGEVLAELPIGQRDARLLRERARQFGSPVDATADCPACGERMAFALDLDALAAKAPAASPDTRVQCSSGRYRLPASRDLAYALAQPQPRLALALQCRLEGNAPLDDAALDELDVACAAADPAAQIDIALACEACGHGFTALFDAGDSLWTDLSRKARRTLDEVHLLATAYGWSEAAVLAVPPVRRQQYLRRVLG